MKIFWKFVLFMGLTIVLATGCASRGEFSKFAQTGGAYATAVDQLLVAAGNARVDSTSWSLLADKADVDTSISLDSYMKKKQRELEYLKQIGRLRKHAQLLGKYFGMLEALATSNAPQRTKTAIDGVMGRLRGEDGLNLMLPQEADAFSSIGELVVNLRIRRALRDELTTRGNTICEELYIQEQKLKTLSGSLDRHLNRSKQIQDRILVYTPLTSPNNFLQKPEQWVSTRRKVVKMSMTVQELNKASQAATKLREAFEGLFSDEFVIGRLNALITDIEGILIIAETINS